MSKTPFFLLVGLVFYLFCCKPAAVNSVEELSQFIQEPANGLIQHVKTKGYQISVAFSPADLLRHYELSSDFSDLVNTDSTSKLHSGFCYFNLSVSGSDTDLLQLNSEEVSALAFRVGNHVTMTSCMRDTITLHDFRVVKKSGSPPELEMLLIFQNEKIHSSEWIRIDIHECGLGIGDQSFQFNTADLRQVPRIQFRAPQ